uniref:Candidate secreted effector Minc08148 n=2 Tax=Meloidogyne incognita TaxID=6306 RepID=A0A914L284_MELIC
MQNNSIYFLSMMILLFIISSVTIAEDEPSILTKRDAFKMVLRAKRCCFGCYGCGGYGGFGGFPGFGGLGIGLGIGAGIGLFGR